ncbi:hypothetical protein NE237_000680 [Protea cynaroides]|uniref:MADS-box domain-containing protein n=1 Tax=Protea cynaroides TaxID=273540 RepID=A0A9Q0KS14_9MAGN|nr:hypothetical protein NE237_000680 [Protea cynaroides]
MGRAKVKLELIAKEKSRNTTFQKRKKGLKKKTYEFSTLCGVDACLIIFDPKQGDGVQPDTWPENRENVLNIIQKFRKHSREEQGKRQLGLPQFLEDQTKKLRSDLVKLRQRNGNAKYPTWDNYINDFSLIELRTLIASLNSKLELVKLNIDLTVLNHDVAGLIEYPVPPPLNQSSQPYWDSSNSNLMDDMDMYMHNQHHQHRLAIDYIPTDPSLVFQTTMVNNGMDCMGNRYGSSSSIVPYHPATVLAPMSNPINYDEMAVLNNTGGQLPFYYSPNMQQMMHSYFQPQPHPINDFSDLQDYFLKH